jgi:hypothetical protein
LVSKNPFHSLGFIDLQSYENVLNAANGWGEFCQIEIWWLAIGWNGSSGCCVWGRLGALWG